MRNYRRSAILVILGAMLVGLVAAPTAAATSLTASSYPVAMSGQQTGAKHVFTAGGGKVECSEMTFSGTLGAASGTQTVVQKAGGCTAFGLAATYTFNECDLLFHYGWFTSSVDVVCPSGKDITIDAGGGVCVIHIPAQTGIGGVDYANNVPHVDLILELRNINATITKSNFLCPLKSETVNNATYSGRVTMKGDGGATSIDIG